MTAILHNDRFLRALNCEAVDKTPGWIMRHAGRYLSEYREVRAQAGDFMTLCQTPELACKVTMQPIERFDLDAAIIFSDILTIPDALGCGLHFIAGEGPKFSHPVRSKRDIERLPELDPEDALAYVMQAIRLTRRELNGKVPLIGFAGSPWTVATYMVEGGSSKTYSRIKALLFDDPDTLHVLLQRLAQATTQYLNAQIAAGAQAIMLFDSWGGVLSPRDYQTFSLAYMQCIVDQLTRENEGRRIPIILFTKGGGQWLEQIAQTGCDAIGVDWTVDLRQARARVPALIALQGNMDPCVLYASPDRIRAEVKMILDQYGTQPGHVFNLGHGIHPGVPPEHLQVLIDAVHEYSSRQTVVHS